MESDELGQPVASCDELVDELFYEQDKGTKVGKERHDFSLGGGTD